jgi:hypothetical protein
MKTIASACFGFALALPAFALTGAPASAFQTGALTLTTPNSAIRVADEDRREYREREEREKRREERRRREARERNGRCEHARRECRESRGGGHEYRECVERRGC